MAENNAEGTEQEADGEAVAPKKSGGGKVQILLIVAVAMLGEAGLFLFLGVGASGAADAATTDAVPAESTARPVEDEDELVEVEVHSFSVTNTSAAADTVVHISFKVHALLASGQESEFKKAVQTSHKVRVRESVETIFRSATMEDLSDSSLSTLKRLVREEINRVLRQSYVVSVVFNDYKTIQQ